MADEVWTFGGLRSFVHEDGGHTEERYEVLVTEMMRAWEVDAAEVEREWIPYALEHLARWPYEVRTDTGPLADWSINPSGEHPLNALVGTQTYEFTRAQYLVDFCTRGHIEGLVSLHALGFDGVELEHGPSYAPFSEDVARAILTGLARAPALRHLNFESIAFGDDWAREVAAATSLEGLVSLRTFGHTMTHEGLLALATSPSLRGLKHLDLGGTNTWMWMVWVNRQLELMSHLPDLLTLFEPEGRVPWDAIAPTWREAPARAGLSDFDALDDVLWLYETDDVGYPFVCDTFGGDVWYDGFTMDIPAESFDDEVSLAHVWDVASLEDGVEPSVYVVGVRAGSLDESFDEVGALVAPLELRTFGRYWADAPLGFDSETYGGACFLQTQLARRGLHAEIEDGGRVVLRPGTVHHASALVRFCRAVDAAERWVGGVFEDFMCSPVFDPGSRRDFPEEVRVTVEWEERDHAFDRRGELTDAGQHVDLTGDAVALLRVLPDFGFEVRHDLAHTTSHVVILDRGDFTE